LIKNIKSFSANIIVLKASETVKKATGSVLATNMFMLGYVSGQSLMPIKKEHLLEGIAEVVPEHNLDNSKQIFELGYKTKS
jgi:Pyruvate/2-oxoacid:ferredoxin oxidoreductase gamma subunit